MLLDVNRAEAARGNRPVHEASVLALVKAGSAEFCCVVPSSQAFALPVRGGCRPMVLSILDGEGRGAEAFGARFSRKKFRLIGLHGNLVENRSSCYALAAEAAGKERANALLLETDARQVMLWVAFLAKHLSASSNEACNAQ